MTSDSLLQRFVQEVLPVICERLQPERVILFGSRARGEARCGSDLEALQTSTLLNAAVREGRVLSPDPEEQVKPLSAAISTQV